MGNWSDSGSTPGWRHGLTPAGAGGGKGDGVNLFWVALGGALGSMARYQVTVWAAPYSRVLPWGTIGINVVGSFVIGLVAALTLPAAGRASPEWVRLLLMTGICGGFTTFSAFSLQTLDLLRAGAVGAALANVGLSVLLCLLVVWAGYAAGSRL